MLDTMRKPLFVIALVLLALAFFADLGTSFINFDAAQAPRAQLADLPSPGLGIRYMALVDGLLLYTVVLIGMPMLITDRIHGRIQGISTFIVSLIVLLLSIGMIVTAIAFLGVMVSLFLAVPFGTAVYFAGFATFAKAKAAGSLALIMALKLGFCGFLFASQQQFIQHKGLIMLVLTALLSNIIISLLHGLVPAFLVSITDCVAAIVIGILAAIWSIVLLLGSIPAIFEILKSFKTTRAPTN